MGVEHWSPTAGSEGDFFSVPGKGAWFRRNGDEAFFVAGDVYELWVSSGAEQGPLGFPTSNFDTARGMQTFENGAIWWDGHQFVSGREPMGSRPINVESAPSVPTY